MSIQAASRLRARHDMSKDTELLNIQKDLKAEGLDLEFNDSHLYVADASSDTIQKVIDELQKDGKVRIEDGVLTRPSFALKRDDGLVMQKLNTTIRLFYTKASIEASTNSSMSMQDVANFMQKSAKSHLITVDNLVVKDNTIQIKTSHSSIKATLDFDFYGRAFALTMIDHSAPLIEDLAKSAINKHLFEGPSRVFDGPGSRFAAIAVAQSERAKRGAAITSELHRLCDERAEFYINLWSFVTAMRNFYDQD